MAGYVVLGVFAACGVMAMVWALLGWLLPAGEGCAVVCVGEPGPGVLSRYRWLRGTGLLRIPLIVVTEEQTPDDYCGGTEICRPEALVFRLAEERKRFDGTGNGDSSGRGQRRGISEL